MKNTYAILPCGMLQTKTGNLPMFGENITDFWKDSSIEVWKTEDGKFVAVSTYGKDSKLVEGQTERGFHGDQSGRYLFNATFQKVVNLESMKGYKAMRVYCYK